MSAFPEIPSFDNELPPGADPVLGGTPQAYDKRRYHTSPEAAPLATEGLTVLYIVESRRPSDSTGTQSTWEVRPHYEHRGGRAWCHVASRIRWVTDVYIHGALAFLDAPTALRCVSSLMEMRRDRTEFRVVELRTERTLAVVQPGGSRAPYTQSRTEQAAYQLLHPFNQVARPERPVRAGTWSAPARASLSGLGSWLEGRMSCGTVYPQGFKQDGQSQLATSSDASPPASNTGE